MDRWLKILLASSVLVAACQTEEADQTGTTEEGVATDAEAAETQIEERTTAFETAIVAADPVALTALYTDDAVLMPPAMARSTGSEAIRGAFEGMFAGATMAAAELLTDEIVVAESGDIAYRVGTYRMNGTLPDGTPWTDTGKFLETWRNVDGEWLIAVDIWNADAPSMGEAGETAPGEMAPGETAAPAGEPAPEADTAP